jgi:hypothetical protein
VTHPYVQAWRDFRPAEPPFVLPCDRGLLASRRIVVHRNLDEYKASGDSDLKDDQRFHLGLLPQPFHGRIENARMYVLMLNPGHDPRDYDWEFADGKFRQGLIDGYEATESIIFLRPEFAAHPGYRWWTVKAQLRHIVREVATVRRQFHLPTGDNYTSPSRRPAGQ